MRSLWHRWLSIAQKIVAVIANIVLAIIYVIIIVPLSFLIKYTAPHRLEGPGTLRKNTYWKRYSKQTFNKDFAQRQ